MEHPIDPESEQWVERQLEHAFQRAPQCSPDTERGLRGLMRLRAERRQRRRRAWTAVGLSIAAAVAIALPPTRGYAARCVEACLAGGEFVLAKLKPSERRSSILNEDRPIAPDFALEDSAGNLVRLSELAGQVVLLNFWATWCGPCRIEMPWFNEFQRVYGSKGFTVIGVSVDDDGWSSVLPYLSEQRIDYPVVVGNEDVLARYGGIESLPTTLIIDRQGRVAATHLGLPSRDAYERDIEAVLEESR